MDVPICQREKCSNPTKVFARSGKPKKFCSVKCRKADYQIRRYANDEEYRERVKTFTRENNRAKYVPVSQRT